MCRSYYVEEKNQAITEREMTHGEPHPGSPRAALSHGIKVPHQPSRASSLLEAVSRAAIIVVDWKSDQSSWQPLPLPLRGGQRP